jgi:hypothetical protein
MTTADEAPVEDEPDQTVPRGRRRWPLVLAVLAAVVVVGLAWVWFSRERIADDFLGAQLEELGLPATYEIEEVGPVRQVLSNIVIGDPANPDLVIERAEAQIHYRFGLPTVGRITVLRPRLYGTYRDGKLSFGSLDKVLFDPAEPKRPFRFPDLDVRVVDGRGLLDSDFGQIGLKLKGAGHLRGGFRGTLAAIAPDAVAGGCSLTRASLYGTVEVRREQPYFTGPLRLAGMICPNGTMIEDAGLHVEGSLDRSLDGGEAELALETGTGIAAGVRLGALKGAGRVSFRRNALTARYELTARALSADALALQTFGAEGSLRSQDGLARMEIDGTLQGAGLALGPGLDETLVSLERGTAGTLLAPMLGQVRTALRRETPGSRFSASYLARLTERGLALTIPQGSLRGGSGQTLLAVSRIQLSPGDNATPRLAGNLVTGGTGLPRISGRMERPSGGEAVLRLTMAEYQAGSARLAVPQLVVAQGTGGALGFVGRAVMSGPLPGGSAENLIVPLDGGWSGAGGLAVWRRCTPLAFDRLAFANLTLERHGVTLCPPRGTAIVRVVGSTTRIAAGAAGLDVAGRLGASPIRISSGPVGFAVPGTLTARSVDVALGNPATASRFRLAELTAQIGQGIAGRFDGTEVRLAAVPLDLVDAQGSWAFADGALSIADGTFRLLDRRADARFEPMAGRRGTLALVDNIIDANALLAEPESGREVVRVAVRHDLGSGRGRANLTVAGVTFDAGLQPTGLTRLALGVVANVRGSVRGTGEIAWTPGGVTSTGRFTTDALDFAAAFGPVKGAAGTLVFTDLLGLVSAPDQRLRVESVNPGIEVTDGEIRYELRPNARIAVLGGSWPFLDGTLTLEPTALNIGIAEVRRYTLRVTGIDAAKFVARLEIPNVAATGTFDGALPLVFDENGGRIEGGALASRSPGGNVSYVGALTYENLSTMANFAFEALKSLDYREMRIGMDGSLTGEIVTRVRFSGVKQGAGATQNFITRRLANLPLQFNINLRAPFYQLITSFKSMYDPAFVKDPRELGLVDAQGRPLAPVIANPAPTVIRPRDIQPPDSENIP